MARGIQYGATWTRLMELSNVFKAYDPATTEHRISRFKFNSVSGEVMSLFSEYVGTSTERSVDVESAVENMNIEFVDLLGAWKLGNYLGMLDFQSEVVECMVTERVVRSIERQAARALKACWHELTWYTQAMIEEALCYRLSQLRKEIRSQITTGLGNVICDRLKGKIGNDFGNGGSVYQMERPQLQDYDWTQL